MVVLSPQRWGPPAHLTSWHLTMWTDDVALLFIWESRSPAARCPFPSFYWLSRSPQTSLKCSWCALLGRHTTIRIVMSVALTVFANTLNNKPWYIGTSRVSFYHKRCVVSWWEQHEAASRAPRCTQGPSPRGDPRSFRLLNSRTKYNDDKGKYFAKITKHFYECSLPVGLSIANSYVTGTIKQCLIREQLSINRLSISRASNWPTLRVASS